VSQFTDRLWRASSRRAAGAGDYQDMDALAGSHPARQVGRARLALSWIVTPQGLQSRWIFDEDEEELLRQPRAERADP
jgi:hypothetical protein